MMIRAVIACLVLSLRALHGAEVIAQLSTDTLKVGEAALLSLRVEGGAPEAAPVIPEVKGLVVNPRGQSQQIQIVDGQVNRALVFNYAVGSHEAGIYEVPSITVRVAGQELSSQPLKITVGGAGLPGGMNDEEAKVPEDGRKYGFLTFQLAKKDRKNVYPGEIAPVLIRAYFPMDARVSLSGPPRPDGAAFTLHHLSPEPVQTRELVNGVEYLAVTWTGGLSATKAGKYPASFTLGGTVAVRDTSGGGGRSPFRGGVMDDFFAPMIQKEVSLTTPEPPEIEVTELPLEGRPEDFAGAIGQFDFDAVQIPESLQTGEPCRIEARIRGAGNFALLKEPQPMPPAEWKVYEGTGEFVPGDEASFAGTKVFRFSAVPRVPGEKELSLGFSFFDPEEGKYRSVQSVPRKVVIRGEAAALPEAAEAKEVVEAEPEGPRLAPLKTELGRVGNYRPWSSEDGFLPMLAGCGLLAALLAGYGWWSGRAVDAAKLARRAGELAARAALSAAERAAHAGDGAAFFLAAREALRIRVAERSGMKPEAVTLADLRGIGDEGVVEILKEADRVDYSGKAAGAGDLTAWREKLHRGLDKLAAGPAA